MPGGSRHSTVSTTSGTGRIALASDLPHGPSYSEGLRRTLQQPNRVLRWQQPGSTCGSRGQRFGRGCGPGHVRAGRAWASLERGSSGLLG